LRENGIARTSGASEQLETLKAKTSPIAVRFQTQVEAETVPSVPVRLNVTTSIVDFFGVK
jgi:hypothetical protein